MLKFICDVANLAMSVMIEVELNWTLSQHIALDAHYDQAIAMPCGELENESSSRKAFHFLLPLFRK